MRLNKKVVFVSEECAHLATSLYVDLSECFLNFHLVPLIEERAYGFRIMRLYYDVGCDRVFIPIYWEFIRYENLGLFLKICKNTIFLFPDRPMELCNAFQTICFQRTYHLRFIPEGVAEVSQNIPSRHPRLTKMS
jgi:hypothetical protein